jgi:hypothetical protein
MNRPERRSPTRRVGVRLQDRAGSETGAPIAWFMDGGQVTKEQQTPPGPGRHVREATLEISQTRPCKVMPEGIFPSWRDE